MVGVINYGAGNLASIQNALDYLGYDVRICRSGKEICSCDNLILPGVGDGSYMMQSLHKLFLFEEIIRWCEEDRPLLGICVGAQILLTRTEEGNTACLALIKGICRKIQSSSEIKVPHMGWNSVEFVSDSQPIFMGIASGVDFYFVHSFFMDAELPENCIAKTEYSQVFPSVIAHNNTIGVQFHPEKSGAPGLRLLDNFLRYYH